MCHKHVPTKYYLLCIFKLCRKLIKTKQVIINSQNLFWWTIISYSNRLCLNNQKNPYHHMYCNQIWTLTLIPHVQIQFVYKNTENLITLSHESQIGKLILHEEQHQTIFAIKTSAHCVLPLIFTQNDCTYIHSQSTKSTRWFQPDTLATSPRTSH